MEKMIDGMVYEFLPDTTNELADGCIGCCHKGRRSCLEIGNDCLAEDGQGGIWKLKSTEDGKAD